MGDHEKTERAGRALRHSNKNEAECYSGNVVVMTELRALNLRMDCMQNAVEKQVNTKIDGLRGSMEKLISGDQEALMRELEKATREMNSNLDTEMGI